MPQGIKFDANLWEFFEGFCLVKVQDVFWWCHIMTPVKFECFGLQHWQKERHVPNVSHFSTLFLKKHISLCIPKESQDQTLPIGSRESFIRIILKTIPCLVLDFSVYIFFFYPRNIEISDQTWDTFPF